MTTKKKIAIACQGGGSHTAFTAGVLKKMLAEGVHRKIDLVALSGTSGGAICATTCLYGLLKTANGSTSPPYKLLVDFWNANSANSTWEKAFNAMAIGATRMIQQGLIPSYTADPYHTDHLMSYWQSLSPREEFLDFQLMLENYIDFSELQSLIKPSSPRLFLGAVDILSGDFKVFDSLNPKEIRAETIMASAGIPTLFKAVEIDGTAYWDGLFSQNPPVADFLKTDMKKRPDEIWVIKINPIRRKKIPNTGADIIDRRNELAGNLSLLKQIQFIEFINNLLNKGALNEELQKKYKPVKIRWIAMSEEMTDSLDYSSKLERDSEFIGRLMDEGEKQAEEFLNSTIK
jgi:NTE family protein